MHARIYDRRRYDRLSIFLIPQLPPSLIIKRCSRVCSSVTDQAGETLLYCGSGGGLAGEYITCICVPCHFPVHSVTDFSTTNDHFLARSTCFLPVLVFFLSFFFFFFFSSSRCTLGRLNRFNSFIRGSRSQWPLAAFILKNDGGKRFAAPLDAGNVRFSMEIR